MNSLKRTAYVLKSNKKINSRFDIVLTAKLYLHIYRTRLALLGMPVTSWIHHFEDGDLAVGTYDEMEEVLGEDYMKYEVED